MIELDEIKKLNTIHTTWKDYCLMMLNSTADPLRSIWREKIVTSMVHWEFNDGSISEGVLAGIEILSALPSDFTEMVVDDHFTPGAWRKVERLSGSKRMKTVIGHYGQESFSNEANLCIKYILKNWDKYSHLIEETPILKKIWGFSQESQGVCAYPDAILTYVLEKPVNDNIEAMWVDVSRDILANGIPSEEYREYYNIDKLEGFPFAKDPDLEIRKKYFEKVCDIFLKEDVSWTPCWKKICICILKNDVSMKYAGFGATLRERQARENAVAAFSNKQEERENAKIAAKKLAEKIEKERIKNN